MDWDEVKVMMVFICSVVFAVLMLYVAVVCLIQS